MTDFIYVVVVVLGALTIIVYATWLLVFRLKKGDPKYLSFREWVRNVFEAIMGL